MATAATFHLDSGDNNGLTDGQNAGGGQGMERGSGRAGGRRASEDAAAGQTRDRGRNVLLGRQPMK